MLDNWFSNIHFAQYWLLPTLLFIPYFIYRYIQKQQQPIHFLKVTTTHFLPTQKTIAIKLRHLPFIIRCMAIVGAIVAAAGPEKHVQEEKIKGEGIDLVLCFDISGSMTEKDLQPNRLTAAKEVAQEFVMHRKGDRIGVVIFSNKSFTLCPLTNDYHTVTQQIANIQNGYLQEDGTAIGSGLATSVQRLKQSKAKSKVIILLTDGVDFGGTIPPDIALQMAKKAGIRVYTIGVGASTNAHQINTLPFNENLLKQIAANTGGLYFHAQNTKSLSNIYASINQLETSTVEISQFRRTESIGQFLIIISIILLAIEFLLQKIWLRQYID